MTKPQMAASQQRSTGPSLRDDRSLPTADAVPLTATELATLRRLGLDGLASPANFTPRYVTAIKRLLGAEEAVGAREQEQGEQGVAGAVNRAEPARNAEVARRQDPIEIPSLARFWSCVALALIFAQFLLVCLTIHTHMQLSTLYAQQPRTWRGRGTWDSAGILGGSRGRRVGGVVGKLV
ncbi:hypothetical protein EDC01DRAFT_650277 [Geopyxis carbonaria]|nr:hypothetical protein EDC01DRAFT_650277 [Geopyxis carbonaria]